MPSVPDYRAIAFTTTSVCRSGRNIGKVVYWKLYAIENYYRVLLHSILSVQVSPSWWQLAVDPKIQSKALNFRQQYTTRPWHTNPGSHDIYYLDLKDLNEIARANSNLLQPIILDIDVWIAKIESIRLPRNIVAHMNFPNGKDKARIDVIYTDFEHLMSMLVAGANINFQTP
jgi:hypothetical protein